MNKKGYILLAISLIIITTFVLLFQLDILNKDTLEKFNGDDEKTEDKPLDTIHLELSQIGDTVTTYENYASFVVISNKKLKDNLDPKYNLYLSEEKDGKFWYVLEVKNIGLGDAKVNLSLIDESGQEGIVSANITRINFNLPFGLKTIEPWIGSAYTADGDNLLAKVDKNHRLVNNFRPSEELVDLNKEYLLYTNSAGIMLRRDAADYLNRMLTDLKAATGKNVVIASAFRPYEEQYKLYVYWVTQLGQEQADRVSARPGFSEHQLGTVVDFINQESNYELSPNFDATDSGKWLSENSYKYGFIKSYPEGKESATGYSYEAWHYRFIGVDNALKVKESGLTLREWLELL